MNPTLTTEQQRNENIAQGIRFGRTIPSDTPIPTTDTISSTSLQPQPEVKFPDAPSDSRMTAAESFVKGTGDSMVKQLQAQTATAAEQAKGDYVNELDTYLEQLSSQTGFSGFLAQEEQKAGIQNLSSEVAVLEGQINTERLARAELKQRLETKGGGLKSGAQAEYQNFARDSLFRETNSLIQLGVRSGQLSAAKATANRLAEAYYEQEQNQLNARKELVDANKELFDKEEARSFNLQYDQAIRELERQEEELKLVQSTKIDALKMAQLNGAPDDVIAAIQNAETPQEVIKAGGQYGNVDLLDRRIKIAQANKAETEALRVEKELDLLNNPVETNGVSPETINLLQGLSDGKREDFTNARHTISEVNRMIELVEQASDMSLLTKATEQGREFLRLRSDITDKLARKRTGAVVSKDEEATFKDILGIGVFDIIAKDDQAIIQGLNEFKNTHEENLSIIDPTGEMSNYLDSLKVKDRDIDVYWGVSSDAPLEFNPANLF